MTRTPVRTKATMSEMSLDVRYIAGLARIQLTPEEERQLSSQLSQILAYAEKLKELDVRDVPPMTHPLPRVNVTRKDEVCEGLSRDEALRNAPAAENGLFMTPKIVE